MTRLLLVTAIVSNLLVTYEASRVVVWLQTVSHVLDGGCLH